MCVNTSADDIYVANEPNRTVIYFANGLATGSNIPSILSDASIGVSAIYLDPDGIIFITDSGQNRIYIYNWLANQTVVSGQGAGPNTNQLNQMERFFTDKNYLFYVAHANSNHVQKWFKGATSSETVTGGYDMGTNVNQLSELSSEVVDSCGNIIVCDSGNHRVQLWSPSATTGQTIIGNLNDTAGSGPNELLDKNNNLYIADYNNLRIQKF